MDLSDFRVSTDPTFLQFKHPISGEPMADDNGAVGVYIVGQDSPAYKKRQAALMEEQAKLAQAKKSVDGIGERLEANRIGTLASCVTEIVNISMNGELLTGPKDNERLLRELPWAGDQIDAAIMDRRLFMKALPKN